MKYIVYLTTNIINNKIYVGVHQTENPDVFDGYLGNGINMFECNPELKHPKYPIHKAIKKYGYSAFKRQTIKVFDTKQEALDLEAFIVDEDFIKRDDTYNATLGGGMPPRIDKAIYQYDLNGNFIKEWKSIVEAANSFNTNGSTIGTAANYKRISFNYYWSFEKVDKLNASEYTELQRKQVHLYDSDFSYVKTFDSYSDCCKDLNTYLAAVQRAIKLGNKVGEYYLSNILSATYSKPPKRKVKGDIHQYDLDGNYIKTFTSKDELKKEGFVYGSVTRAIREDASYKQFIWVCGEKLDKVPPKHTCKARKIGQYTMEGELVKIWNTMRECKKEFPNVSKVLRGQAKHCHNYFFKYEE
jgi:hypothetical protein